MSDSQEINLVTGAFSYSGRFISEELLKSNSSIKTLTEHPRKDLAFFNRLDVHSYHFDNYTALVKSLECVTTFINTFWIRFPKGDIDWDWAVNKSKLIFEACKDAGVKRIVHLSVTNPSLDSPYPYFEGKARVEKALKQVGVPYSIIRPALIFEDGDILLNNISWLLRKFPVFALFGSGKFKVQPISQSDLAKIVVNERFQFDKPDNENRIIDAIGPDTFEFIEIVRMLNSGIGARTLILRFPGILRWIPFVFSKLFGLFLKDVLLTRHEMDALRDNLLLTDSKPLGKSSFEEWINNSADVLGKKYSHEINRHY